MEVRWENRGVAPAYHDFHLVIRLAGAGTADLAVSSGNRRWLPEPEGALFTENYSIRVPAALAPGSYTVKLKLRSVPADRDVSLPLDRDLLDEDGFYRITEVQVEG